MKFVVLLLAPVLVFLGLNYQQLMTHAIIWSETNRLVDVAEMSMDEYQNPEPMEDQFKGELSSNFWKFTVINGGGQASNKYAWHSAAITFDDGLTLSHFPDSQNTDTPQHPTKVQYNNSALIGGSGFRPTPDSDVVLKFSAKVDQGFYGSAGVIFQLMDTLQKDGSFSKPFDMFGFAVTGKESSILEQSGSLCYLALNWVPTEVEALPVNAEKLHNYELRLRWISKTDWVGILKVDDKLVCEMAMPAFGPVEVQVWSDNYLVVDHPRQWWEIGPSMQLKFQDGGDKQFHLEKIEIFEEVK